ncbi:MAG: tyrosine-type recombinase/integrase [Spirochaetia bacterium]|jgi:integrase|nr:tyrosine-type recombinase/integrase [Spirochaetia bacterium]
MRRFYLFKRGHIWYIQLKNPKTGKPLPAKSSGTTDKNQAEFIAGKWLYEGIPAGQTEDPRNNKEIFTIDEILGNLKNVDNLTSHDVKRFLNHFKAQGFISNTQLKGKTEKTLIEFLNEFWNFEKSFYVQEKKAHGQQITKNYCDDMKRHIKNYWTPYFNNISLNDLTRQKVKEFGLYLSKTGQINKPKKRLSVSLINNILKVGKTSLNYAFSNGLIEINPAANLMKFNGDSKQRGILSDSEVKKLLNLKWYNESAKHANLLSMQTGLRSGEILALQIQDISTDRIIVRHSISRTDGLKSTKTNKEREVPLLPETRRMLLDYAKNNPQGVHPTSFIFFQMDNPDKPMRQETLNASLAKELKNIKPKIKDDERTARGICFHSWRHYFSRKMADVLSERTMKLTGHSTIAVFEAYADHKNEADFQKAIDATSEVFGRVLPFKEVI